MKLTIHKWVWNAMTIPNPTKNANSDYILWNKNEIGLKLVRHRITCLLLAIDAGLVCHSRDHSVWCRQSRCQRFKSAEQLAFRFQPPYSSRQEWHSDTRNPISDQFRTNLHFVFLQNVYQFLVHRVWFGTVMAFETHLRIVDSNLSFTFKVVSYPLWLNISIGNQWAINTQYRTGNLAHSCSIYNIKGASASASAFAFAYLRRVH